MEKWVKINGLDGYEISNLGRLKSIDRRVSRGNGDMFLKGRIMKQTLKETGYLIANLYNGKKDKHYRIHRLVAENFIPNPEKKRTVNHKNGIKTDNRVQNLEWATHSENHIHAYRELNRKSAWTGVKGRHSHASKPVLQYSKKGELLASFYSMKEAAEAVGIEGGHICSVCKGKRKTTGGYIWKYKNEVLVQYVDSPLTSK